jgi:hypothetical protein
VNMCVSQEMRAGGDAEDLGVDAMITITVRAVKGDKIHLYTNFYTTKRKIQMPKKTKDKRKVHSYSSW